jgi:hypothetical protein
MLSSYLIYMSDYNFTSHQMQIKKEMSDIIFPHV